MMTFSMVKKIGEGKYLDEDLFIIERVRRERAMNVLHPRGGKGLLKRRFFGKNGKNSHS